ncbi:unnamed protein product [Miscanthus lutarioriparius]|uniref:Uncharacterized protein n=1 Tax=Miscanthus lutarioriparius TaxID=422564 RepID=A0A811R8E5_9POAL|nr:unnamed protein product [Miscanthus lutarioriparius]
MAASPLAPRVSMRNRPKASMAGRRRPLRSSSQRPGHLTGLPLLPSKPLPSKTTAATTATSPAAATAVPTTDPSPTTATACPAASSASTTTTRSATAHPTTTTSSSRPPPPALPPPATTPCSATAHNAATATTPCSSAPTQPRRPPRRAPHHRPPPIRPPPPPTPRPQVPPPPPTRRTAPPHIHPPPAPVPPPPSPPHHIVIIVVFVSLSGLLLLACLAALLCWHKKRGRKTETKAEVLNFSDHVHVHKDTMPGPGGANVVRLTVDEDVKFQEAVKKQDAIGESSNTAAAGKTTAHHHLPWTWHKKHESREEKTEVINVTKHKHVDEVIPGPHGEKIEVLSEDEDIRFEEAGENEDEFEKSKARITKS